MLEGYKGKQRGMRRRMRMRMSWEVGVKGYCGQQSARAVPKGSDSHCALHQPPKKHQDA